MLPTPVFLGFLCGSADKESAYNEGDLGSIPGFGRSPGEGKGYPPIPIFWPGEFHGLYSPWGCKELDTTERLSILQSSGGFPGGTSGKEPACQCRRQRFTGFISGLGRSPEGGHSNPLQYSCLENPKHRGAWRAPQSCKESDMTDWLSMLACPHAEH